MSLSPSGVKSIKCPASVENTCSIGHSYSMTRQCVPLNDLTIRENKGCFGSQEERGLAEEICSPSNSLRDLESKASRTYAQKQKQKQFCIGENKGCPSTVFRFAQIGSSFLSKYRFAQLGVPFAWNVSAPQSSIALPECFAVITSLRSSLEISMCSIACSLRLESLLSAFHHSIRSEINSAQ